MQYEVDKWFNSSKTSLLFYMYLNVLLKKKRQHGSESESQKNRKIILEA